MNENQKIHGGGCRYLKCAGDIVLAAALVLAICWGLLQAARALEERPIQSNRSGEILLPAWQARLQGQVAKYPDNLERQNTDFAYHYGRDLHAERLGRKIGRWRSTDAQVEWVFQVAEPGMYAVELEYACPPEEAGSEYVVTVADRDFNGSIASTGGADQWKTNAIGKVQIAAPGVYRLHIQARKIAHENLMNLKRVVLKKETI